MSGDLRQTPLGLLLIAFAEAERTCVLEIKSQNVVKRISIQRGTPVQCRSNVLQDTFACYLRDQGTLTQEAYKDCLQEATARRAPVGDVLVERRILSSDQILGLLQKLLAKVLLDAFAWSSGTYAVFDEPVGLSAPLKVKVPQLVLTGATRFAPQEVIRAATASLGNARVLVHPKTDMIISQLRLGANESRFLEIVREPKTLTECSKTLGLDEATTQRALYALGLLGLVCRESDAISAPAPPSSEEAASPFTLIRKPPRQRMTKSEVASLFLNHLRMDPFELLDIGEDAHPEVIEQSYIDLIQGLAGWVSELQDSQRTTDQARTLLLSAATAYAQLVDERTHEQLVIERINRKHLSRLNSEGDEHPLIDPESQLTEGLRLKEEKHFEQALKCFEVASGCKPLKGRYRAEAAHCLFKMSRRRAEDALRILEESRRIDPECGHTCLYSGEICIELKRYDEAYDWLRNANVLMAPDPAPIKLLGELQERRDREKR